MRFREAKMPTGGLHGVSFMTCLANFLVGLMALLQFLFLVMEMFLWQTPFGRRTFRMSEAQARDSAVLAKNQGLYNGFLSAGLIWGLVSYDPIEAFHIKVFFLICVLIAGVYGQLTAGGRILVVQALPAAAALCALGTP